MQACFLMIVVIRSGLQFYSRPFKPLVRPKAAQVVLFAQHGALLCLQMTFSSFCAAFTREPSRIIGSIIVATMIFERLC